MKVIIRSTGILVLFLSMACTGPQKPTSALPSLKPPTEPPTFQFGNVAPQIKKNALTPVAIPPPGTAAPPIPVGVVVNMSDGTTRNFPLGIYLEFQSNGVLRGIFPSQYVDQIAVYNAPPIAGTSATASAVVASTLPTVLSFTIINGGSGYIAPYVTITGGSGQSGSVLTTVVSGVITAINAPGATGYTTGDILTVTITDTPTGTWTYSKPGRNVQVWRNGLLQRLGPDYTLNQAGATITPVRYPDANNNLIGWDSMDYVTVGYLF